MPVFRSESAFLRVSFTPEQYGLGEGVEEYFDAEGNPRRKRAPLRPVKFIDGVASVDDVTAKRLRQHRGFKESFWEEPASDSAALSTLSLAPGVTVPKEITQEHWELLARIAKRCEGIMPPRLKGQLIADYHEAVKVFQVHGTKAPLDTDGVAAAQVRCRDLLELLAAKGVKINAEPDPGDSGDGAGAN